MDSNDSQLFLHKSIFWIFLTLILILYDQSITFNDQRIGLDYGWQFIGHLLDGVIWHRFRGFDIPWFTPSFCGGAASFGHPQSLYYSIPQLLSFFIPVLDSIRIFNCLVIGIGAISMRLFITRVLNVTNDVASLGGLLFISSGFFAARIVVGHFNYIPLALLPVFLIFLFYSHSSRLYSILILTFLSSQLIYIGAFMAIPLMILCMTFMTPTLNLISILKRDTKILKFKEVVLRSVVILIFTSGIAASKIIAIIELTSHIQRDVSFENLKSASKLTEMIISQLFLLPSANSYGYTSWEFSMFLNPIVLLGLILFLFKYFKFSHLKDKGFEFYISLLFCLLSIIFITLFIKGDNIASYIINLVGKMRINIRFTASLIAPLVILSCIGLDNISEKNKKDFLLFSLVSVLGTTFLCVLINWKTSAYFDSSNLRNMEEHARYRTREELSVQIIRDTYDEKFELYDLYSSDKNCYESLYIGDNITRKLIIGETPFFIKNEFYNYINPSCIQFPSENNCSPGDLFKVDQREDLEKFLLRRSFNFKMSESQKIANQITIFFILAWLFFALFIVIYSLKKFTKLMK